MKDQLRLSSVWNFDWIVKRLELRRIRFDCQAVGTSGSIVNRLEIRYGKERDYDLGDRSIWWRESDETVE